MERNVPIEMGAKITRSRDMGNQSFSIRVSRHPVAHVSAAAAINLKMVENLDIMHCFLPFADSRRPLLFEKVNES